MSHRKATGSWPVISVKWCCLYETSSSLSGPGLDEDVGLEIAKSSFLNILKRIIEKGSLTFFQKSGWILGRDGEDICTDSVSCGYSLWTHPWCLGFLCEHTLSTENIYPTWTRFDRVWKHRKIGCVFVQNGPRDCMWPRCFWHLFTRFARECKAILKVVGQHFRVVSY